jgi:hypothetical protein
VGFWNRLASGHRLEFLSFHRLATSAALGVVCVGFLTPSCSTVEIAPPTPPPAAPEYLKVPHPAGQDLLDLIAILNGPGAPATESMKDCDADFRRLSGLTASKDEMKQGVSELVSQDPVKYHWCFYTKLSEVESRLKTDLFLDERQKLTLDVYEFLVPIARTFLEQYRDSRYLRYASSHYKRVSEWIFFRKLELSPQGTVELVEAANPFGLYRTPGDGNLQRPKTVLEKYGLGADVRVGKGEVDVKAEPEATAAGSDVKQPTASTAPAAAPETVPSPSQPERAPAADSAPLPSQSTPSSPVPSPAPSPAASP